MILVTGGSGYVGSKLVPMLAQYEPVRVMETMNFGNPIEGTPNVEFVQGDIRNVADIRPAMKGVDAVIHLAGIVTDELVDMNAELSYDVNILATRRLCQEAAKAGVERFIYASSSSVYGAQDVECTEATEPKPQTAYARQKLGGEKMLAEFKDKMWVFSVRSATCCGPAPRMRLDTIVNTFCAQAYFKKRITVWGGNQYRSNIHVADVAALYCNLATQPAVCDSGLFINAVHMYHQALDLARLVQSIIPCDVECDATKVDPRSYRMGSLPFRALKWFPTRSIESAIQDNLRWFQTGGVTNPDLDLYHNTRRMAGVMQHGQKI